MKTTLTTLFTVAAFAASSGFAADLVVSSDISTSGTFDNVLFTADGKTLTSTANITANGYFSVSSDVAATATNASTTAYYIGAGDTSTAARIFGAGSSLSTLNFTGYVLSSKANTTQSLSVNDITLNFKNSSASANTNYIRGQTLSFTNSIVNVQAPVTAGSSNYFRTYGSTTSDGIMFDHSALLIDAGASFMLFVDSGYYGAGTSRVISFSNGSFLINDGTFNINSFGVRLNDSTAILNGTISGTAAALMLTNSASLNLNTNLTATSLSATDSTVANTATLTNTGTLTLSNSTFTTETATSGGAVSLTGSTLDIGTSYGSGTGAVTINGVNSIKGSGTFTSSGGWIFASVGSLYITTASFSSGSWINNDYDQTTYIGADSLGAESAVAATIGSIQFNYGRLILKGGSALTVSSGNFNLAVKTGTQSNFASGTSVTVSNGSSRINNAYIDGTLSVAGGAQTSNGWNYSLAFGAYSTTNSAYYQKGTVTIGANAQITDNATASTYFGMYGTITSYAGVGKVTSNANAPLMLYKDTTLTLNSTDAFAVGGAATQAASIFNLYAGANVSLAVNADNNIGAINFRDGTTKLALSIAEGKLLALGSFTNAVTGGLMAIALGDTLQYGEFKITDMSDTLSRYAAQSSLNFTDGSSSRVLGTNLFITETGVASGEYWIYTVAVPEPAEWAAIFGAIAIGFALYRRRRS